MPELGHPSRQRVCPVPMAERNPDRGELPRRTPTKRIANAPVSRSLSRSFPVTPAPSGGRPQPGCRPVAPSVHPGTL